MITVPRSVIVPEARMGPRSFEWPRTLIRKNDSHRRLYLSMRRLKAA